MLAQPEFQLLLQAGVGLDSMSNSMELDAQISGISVKLQILIKYSVIAYSIFVMIT